MQKFWHLVFVVSVSVAPVSAIAGEPEGYFTIPVPHLHEPTSAIGETLSLSGRCFHERIRVTARYLPSGAISNVTVSVNGKARRFDAREPFVHDLFSGPVALQYGVVCSGTGFELTAWGASYADPAAARFVLGQAFFDPQGRVTDYDMTTESYDFISSHMRP